MQKVVLAEDVFNVLLDGEKDVTIINGRCNIELGPLEFQSITEKRKQNVDVVTVTYTRLRDIPDDMVWADDYTDHTHLLERMKEVYPETTDDTECTIIIFSIENSEN